MGVGFGLVQGLTKGVTGAQEGEAIRKKMERDALHQAMADSLLKAQTAHAQQQANALSRPAADPAGQYFIDDSGNVTYSTKGQAGRAVEGVKGISRPRSEATPRIDPLSPEGIKASAAREAAVRAAAPPTQAKQNPTIVQKVASNQQQIGKIQEAIAALKKNPDAVGLKGLLPNIALQRLDPKGTKARNPITDVGSLVIHDRSGAAVTAKEFSRLGFIPLPTDTYQDALDKLERFLKYSTAETDFLQKTPVTDSAGNEVPAKPAATGAASTTDRARALARKALGK